MINHGYQVVCSWVLVGAALVALGSCRKSQGESDSEDSGAADGGGVVESPPAGVGTESAAAKFKAISAGNGFTCAVTVGGSAKCWGWNEFRQLGDDTIVEKHVPTQVEGLESNVAAISSGVYHTCVVTTEGAVMCWGGARGYGELGSPGKDSQFVPEQVVGLKSGMVGVAGGDSHTCGLTFHGGVMCWGRYVYGQTGWTTEVYSAWRGLHYPRLARGLNTGVSSVVTGSNHTCVITTSGAAKCFGKNLWGQIGDGGNIGRSVPTQVTGLEYDVVSVTAGDEHTCALTKAGAVLCWGWNKYGQLGDGTTKSRKVPTEVVGMTSGVKAISAGLNHTCAIASDNRVKCWGRNEFGQLGDGGEENSSEPTQVVGMDAFAVAISAGQSHTCALTEEGGARCWGWNQYGGLGDDTTENRSRAVKVVGYP